jgi:hypothetical protein
LRPAVTYLNPEREIVRPRPHDFSQELEALRPEPKNFRPERKEKSPGIQRCSQSRKARGFGWTTFRCGGKVRIRRYQALNLGKFKFSEPSRAAEKLPAQSKIGSPANRRKSEC